MSMPELPPNLQLALEACVRVAQATPTGEICFRAIPEEFKTNGVTYHDLAMLESLGYLTGTGDASYFFLTPHPNDPPESQWQEVNWSVIGKRLLLKGVVGFGTILAKATLEELFSQTYEDKNGRKHDKKTGRFTP